MSASSGHNNSSRGKRDSTIAIHHLSSTLTLWVIVVCVAVYLIQAILNLLGVVPFQASYSLLRLSRAGLFGGGFWQPFTSPFVHFGSAHLAFNMLSLAFLGVEVERHLGWARYVIFSAFCAMVASAGFLAFSGPQAIGAGYSRVIYGILAAAAILRPNDVIQLFWVFPVKMKWAMVILGVMAFFAMIQPAQDGVAHSAHLFGAAAGWIFMKQWGITPPKSMDKPGGNVIQRLFGRHARPNVRKYKVPDKL